MSIMIFKKILGEVILLALFDPEGRIKVCFYFKILWIGIFVPILISKIVDILFGPLHYEHSWFKDNSNKALILVSKILKKLCVVK